MKEVSPEYTGRRPATAKAARTPGATSLPSPEAIWTLRAEQHRSRQIGSLAPSSMTDPCFDILAYMDAGEKEIPADMDPGSVSRTIRSVFIFPPLGGDLPDGRRPLGALQHLPVPSTIHWIQTYEVAGYTPRRSAPGQRARAGRLYVAPSP